MSTVDVRKLSSDLKEFFTKFPSEAKNIGKEQLFTFLKSKGYAFVDCKNKCGEYERPKDFSCCKHYDPELSKCFLLDDMESE